MSKKDYEKIATSKERKNGICCQHSKKFSRTDNNKTNGHQSRKRIIHRSFTGDQIFSNSSILEFSIPPKLKRKILAQYMNGRFTMLRLRTSGRMRNWTQALTQVLL